MPRSFFIIGTDTEVGKTFVTAGLAFAAQSKGLSVAVSKPISCGGIEDAKFYKLKLKLKDSIDSINPIKFRQPLSPYAAKKTEKISIDIRKIQDSVKKLTRSHDLIFVEGLGGALAPIKKNYYVADMAKDLNIPCVIIARAGLGTINHTLMTLEALKKRKIRIAGIIMNGFDGKEPSQISNSRIIEELSRIKVIGKIKAKSSFKELVEQLKEQKILKKLGT